MTVEFDQASHHTRDVTGLEVILRGFGDGNIGRGNKIVGIIIEISLLRGPAVFRIVLRGNGGWAGLSRSLSGTLVTFGRRGGRGRRTVPIVCIHVVRARGLGSELGNSGTRELVGSIAESIDEDTRVVVRVCTRELDEFTGAGDAGLTTTDVDLDAGGVELCASGLISQMKGDDFMTEEISTASKGGRKLERMGLSVDYENSVSVVDQR